MGYSFKLSFRKLAAFEWQCYQNALRLHLDSAHLLHHKSFASAFALSVVACEELGKGLATSEIAYRTRTNGREITQTDKQLFGMLLSDHRLKQGWFARHAFPADLKRMLRYTALQKEKNNALYVGVSHGNHHIIRPQALSKSKARQQVKEVNNVLLDFIRGTRVGAYEFEEIFDAFLRNRTVLKKLQKAATALR